MSRPSSHEIKCSSCGTNQEVTVWDTVNVTLNPELKGQLLEGEPNCFTCRICGSSGWVLAPLLYHDMERRLGTPRRAEVPVPVPAAPSPIALAPADEPT